MLSRRLFVRWSAALGAMLAAGRRLAGAAVSAPPSGTPQGSASQSEDLLFPLAEVVLPAELGTPAIRRAAAAFEAWTKGYREGAELLHPYGSERINRSGPFPARWNEQLTELQRSAASQHRQRFSELARAEREALVRAALAAMQVPARVPSLANAPHVAIALLAHFLESPEATNLCYERRIDPRTCRPLRDSAREPLPLLRAGRG